MPDNMAGAAADLSFDIARQRVEVERRSAEDYLDAVRRRLEREGIHARTKVEEGAPATVILEHAREASISLIAMSTHGRGGLERMVFGSVADEVLRNSHVPVLLIHPDGSR